MQSLIEDAMQHLLSGPQAMATPFLVALPLSTAVRTWTVHHLDLEHAPPMSFSGGVLRWTALLAAVLVISVIYRAHTYHWPLWIGLGAAAAWVPVPAVATARTESARARAARRAGRPAS